jgi:hypothetical protein
MLEEKMKRCTRCILPENYPGTDFDNKGVCGFCNSYRPKEYRGDKKLKEEIEKVLNTKKYDNSSYDCVVAISGGRDSSYLLWYAVKQLGLKVVAYSAEHCFVPKLAIQNTKRIADKVKAELFIEKNRYLKRRCFEHHLNAFAHKPSPAMIGVLCTGCKLGIDMGLKKIADKNNIPIVLLGGSPFEVGSYKTGLMRIDPKDKSTSSFVQGYIREIIRNPKWIMHANSLMSQYQEFYHLYYKRTLKKRLRVIGPYYSYLKWDEKKIINTLVAEMGWEQNTEKNKSTWKTDCHIAPLRKYLYKKILGFNDMDDHLSALVRDGQLTRDEAMERLENESAVPDNVLTHIFSKLNIDENQWHKVIDF